MAKLTGVKTIDMVNGEITKVSYNRAEYVREGAFKGSTNVGNLLRSTDDNFSYFTKGEYYEVIRETPDAVIDNVGDNPYIGMSTFDVFRKISAQATPTIADVNAKVDGLAERVSTLESPKVEHLKVGDKVRVLNWGEFGGVNVGQIGEVGTSFASSQDENNVKVYGADGDHDYFRPQDLRIATDEEVAEAEETAKRNEIFTQAGRKPNEYRKGDIVRADKALYGDCDGMVGYVEDVGNRAIGVRFYGERGSYRGVLFDEGGKATLIATVESRLDRK